MNQNKKHYDVAIIGGGAAGLLCAVIVKSRKPDCSVAIIEAQNRVGKKLLTTGNGRCNLTNLYANSSMYHGTFNEGAEYLLEFYPPEIIVRLFENLGLLTYADNEGRVYPVSRQANSVLDVLRLAIDKSEIDVLVNSKVKDIKKQNLLYLICCEDKIIKADKIVVASGSRSAPSTGADDSMLGLLRKFGHTIISPTPALCPVYVESSHLKSIKGVRASGSAKIIKNNVILREEYGEIQFTENALSGICVFNLARIANTEHNTEISVCLLPDRNYNEIFELLKNKKAVHKASAKADELLIGFFNKMLGLSLIKSAGISPNLLIKEITDAQLKKLASIIIDWRFKVNPAKDFSRSQVTAGGVYGKEIDHTTMKSKKTENLYIIGEVVDCDGDCGGMNLQFAFSSAYCAANDITL